MTALASCTDDLSVSQGKFAGKADLIATLDDGAVNTRLGMSEVEGHNPWAEKGRAGWKWVFTEGDKVRVWSLKSQEFEVYNLIDGWDSPSGKFKKDGASATLPAEYDRWAVTDAQFAYSLSPNANGEPVLTYTIPYQYTASTHSAGTNEDGNEVDVRKFPAPFWGPATVEGTDDESTINVTMNALTAFLRIDMQTLPEGTKYIILTTHGSVMKDPAGTGDNVEEGFQLLTPDPDNTNMVKDASGASVAFQDNLTFWNNNAEEITDGNSEALTGTFMTVLEDKQSALHKDEGLANEEEGDDWGMAGISRLVTRDEMIVKVPSVSTGGVFWIPIIANTYNNLHVIAATDKSTKYAYKYIGTELHNFHDFPFDVAGRYNLTMSMTNLGKVCAHNLNKAIKDINKANKYNMVAQNIINIDELVDCGHIHTDLATYPNDQILVQGEGNLVLNIAEISATSNTKGNVVSPVLSDVIDGQTTLFVSDKNYGNGTTYQRSDYSTFSGTKTNSVKINVPTSFAEADHAILADLPETNVIFAANTDGAPAAQQDAKELRIDVHGAPTEFVNGKEVRELDADGDYILKESEQAAITVESGFGQVNVLAKTKGDVFINGAANEAKLELTDGLFIYTDEGLNVRLENALAKNVGFLASSNRHENYLITTGTSAMQAVGVAKALGEGELEDELVPNDLSLLAYWTGYGLDADAEDIDDYDNGTVYTAAQLATMGEKIGTTPSTTAEYKVNDLLEYIWLGGKKYGWIGPEVTVDNFKFDGNNVALLNMYNPGYDNDGVDGDVTRKIYIYDPHICCTTCGWNRPTDGTTDDGGSAATPLTEFGLIRSIKNAGDGDEIKNVKLNDVYATGSIGNVGSLVGTFEATTAHELTLDNNRVGEVRINVTGDKVGGLIGNVENVAELKIDYNTVGNSYATTGYIKGGNYVGGTVGYVKEADNGTLTIIDTEVAMAENIEAATANAGGLVGYSEMKTVALTKDKVAAKNIIATEGNNAAGFVANLIGDEATVIQAVVNVEQNIETGKQYAGGLVAYDGAETKLLVGSSDIDAGTIKAEDGYVGGEVAYADRGTVEFGYSNYNDAKAANTVYSGRNAENNVAVGTLAGAFNVGGFVGNNNNNANVYLYGYAASERSTLDNIVEITKFENTKDNLDSYFTTTGSEANSHLAGTMSNIVGKLDGKLYINKSKLTVTDNLDGEMKKAVGYTHHNDQGATPELATRLFWGDSNGYVGFGKSGNYFIDQDNTDMGNARNAVVGDQALNTKGFNLYKLEADYQ